MSQHTKSALWMCGNSEKAIKHKTTGNCDKTTGIFSILSFMILTGLLVYCVLMVIAHEPTQVILSP